LDNFLIISFRYFEDQLYGGKNWREKIGGKKFSGKNGGKKLAGKIGGKKLAGKAKIFKLLYFQLIF
jgi:hypothetical protein